MKITKNNKSLMVILCLMLAHPVYGYDIANECPGGSCGPCGEFITNRALPTLDCPGVQPLQNYLASYQSCLKSGLDGFYFGTGFGFGSVNYNLKIPGLTVRNNSDSSSYIIEYATVGFAHSGNSLFIAAELGYYYESVKSPIFYEDHGAFTFVTPAGPLLPGEPSFTTTVVPCNVRLDINAQHHVALDLLPGFVATPCLTFFGRVGLEYTSYTWLRRMCFPNVDVLLGGVSGPLSPFLVSIEGADFNDKQNDSLVDFRLGAGAAYAITRHISLNINYIHVFGSKASFTPRAALLTANAPAVSGLLGPTPGTLTSNLNTLLAVNSIDPERNEILLGVTFSF